MNVVIADFKNKFTAIVVESRFQYDYGQILKFEGIDNLTPAFEVDFSNREDMGEAITQIGSPSSGVPVPDSLLETGKDIYAYMFLHNQATDGQTRYKVKIPVKKRPKPVDIEVTPQQQNTIDAAIALFQEAANPVTEAAQKAEAAIHTYPRIIDNRWYVWDVDQEAFVDTGINATGQEGVGISDVRDNDDNTLTLILTDGRTYTTKPIKGDKGDTGVGIANIRTNDDLSLTIILDNGVAYTTPPLVK